MTRRVMTWAAIAGGLLGFPLGLAWVGLTDAVTGLILRQDPDFFRHLAAADQLDRGNKKIDLSTPEKAEGTLVSLPLFVGTLALVWWGVHLAVRRARGDRPPPKTAAERVGLWVVAAVLVVAAAWAAGGVEAAASGRVDPGVSKWVFLPLVTALWGAGFGLLKGWMDSGPNPPAPAPPPPTG